MKSEKAQQEDLPQRCPHWQLIRTFYAVATELGLDTRDGEGMRQALSHYFGFRIESRAELTATHWICATAGLQAGELRW